MLREKEREKLAYMTNLRSSKNSEIQSCVMDRSGRFAHQRPPSTNHHGFLAHQERGILILGALGGVFPVGVKGVTHLFLVGVLLELKPVVEVLPSAVDEVLLALLVLQHQTFIHYINLQKVLSPINLPFIMGIARDDCIPRDLFIPLLTTNSRTL